MTNKRAINQMDDKEIIKQLENLGKDLKETKKKLFDLEKRKWKLFFSLILLYNQIDE